MTQTGGSFNWLASSALAEVMRSSLWMYPIVEILHIIGIVLLVGSVAMFDLRLLGLSKSLPVRGMARHLLRWSLLGLLLMIPTGLLMFSAHPDEFASNPVFLLKLSLILIAGLNALAFHRSVYRSVDDWDTGAEAPASARLQALASLGLWIAVISCGRLLAYT